MGRVRAKNPNLHSHLEGNVDSYLHHASSFQKNTDYIDANSMLLYTEEG